MAMGPAPAAALFRSPGDPARLPIMSRSAQGSARVVDLTRPSGSAQSTVSKHLACLRDCQLVGHRTGGRQSYCCLTRTELTDLLRSAALLLAETGDALALCPAHGGPTTSTTEPGESGDTADPPPAGAPAPVTAS